MNLSEQNTMAKPLATACHLPFQVEDNEDETNGKEWERNLGNGHP